MLIKCSECKAEISDRAAACPQCGAPILRAAEPRPQRPPEPEGTPLSTWLWVIGTAVVGMVLVAYLNRNVPRSEKDVDRVAIDLCWKDQQRKALDPGQQRFIAGACEKMESDFRARYNATP